MKGIQRFPKTLDPVVLTGVVLAGTLGAAITAAAQDVQDLQTPKGSLVLKAQGSFFVNGEEILAPAGALGAGRDAGHIIVNQMYVQYMIPQGGGGKVPVLMVHGGGLSGKSFETTPDGRMGWNEYFVRQGYPVYNADQVSRARSSFDVTPINEVRQGSLPTTALPNAIRTSEERAWTAFRFGPTFGVPYPDTQFPVDHAAEFAKQGVPDLNGMLPTPNPIYKALSDLAIKLKGAVLMGHSESSAFPTMAALQAGSTGVRGIIQLELGCFATLTLAQITTLSKIPILIVVADRYTPPLPPATCVTEMQQINSAGGDMTFISLPDVGLHGNSHMMMLDKNNLQVADVIIDLINKHVK